MSYIQERIDIETRLSTGWGTTTPIAWDNVDYVPTAGTPWIRCEILPGDVEALEFGRDTKKEYEGIININIFTEKDTGSVLARTYADTLSALFSMVEFGTIDCDEAKVINLNNDEDWYQFNVSIPFTRRE